MLAYDRSTTTDAIQRAGVILQEKVNLSTDQVATATNELSTRYVTTVEITVPNKEAFIADMDSCEITAEPVGMKSTA